MLPANAMHFALADPKSAPYTDLTSDFSRFVDETAGMEEAARVTKFHERMAPLLPGFYEPRFGATPEKYDARIARALDGFAAQRAKYARVQREFPAAFDAVPAGPRDVSWRDDTPATLVWGMRDPVLPPSILHHWQRTLPHAETIEIDDASHFLQEDAPEQIVAAIAAFMAANP